MRLPGVTIAATVACAAAAAVPTATGAAEIAGHLRVAIASGAGRTSFADSGHNRFVIVNQGDAHRIAEIHRHSPQTKVLMYANFSFMSPGSGDGNSGTGVTTQQARGHPGWYLRGHRGRRFTSRTYRYRWAADVGDRGYQDEWARGVIRRVKDLGFDGVFADDVNPTMRDHYPVRAVRRYPNDAAYGAATGSMLADVGPMLREAGVLLIANFGEWRLFRTRVAGWLADVDGGMEEQFAKWGGGTRGTGYAPARDWAQQIDAQKDAEARGKYFLAVTHSARGDTGAARYGWASALLNAAGHTSFAMQADYLREPRYLHDYDALLGDPSGGEEVLPGGVHRRVFSDGLVLVNPTLAARRVSFGGRYSGSGLRSASSATLRPHRALLLVRARAVAEARRAVRSVTVGALNVLPG